MGFTTVIDQSSLNMFEYDEDRKKNKDFEKKIKHKRIDSQAFFKDESNDENF